jgi:hypothetical protein
MPVDAEAPAPQRETTTVQVETNQHINVATIETVRTPDGVQVKVASPALEAYFKAMHARIASENGREPDGYYGQSSGVPGKAYRVDMDRVHLAGLDCYLGHWERSPFDSNFRSDSVVNLSIFRAVGLGEGYTRTFLTPLVSRQAIQQWVNLATRATKALYVEYLKPVRFRITITSEERI